MKSSTDSHDSHADTLMELVEWQVAFGPRYPGSPNHTAFHAALRDRLNKSGHTLLEQDFVLPFRGKECSCINFILVIRGDQTAQRGPLLIGTHFDTRVIGDRESSPQLRAVPIPGANDGGSGTAVLLYFIDQLEGRIPCRDLYVVFFDAEDVGNLEGYEFSMGARYLAENPMPGPPEDVLILDMIGGEDMVLDVDAHVSHYPGSRRLTEEVFRLAGELGMKPFSAPKPNKVKYIICDHAPFMMRGIPSCVLIDIDYPEWHTQADLPDAMSGQSLLMMADLLSAYLLPAPRHGALSP